MNLQDAHDSLQNLLNYLWNSPDRFTSGEVADLIQALENFAIPLIEKQIEIEKIAERFNEIGNPGYIMTQAELEHALGIKPPESINLKGEEI